MTKKERAQMIVERLEQVYPEGICSLDYKKPHELMIAGRLSAQCTDARVNIVTKELFAKYKKCTDIYCERYEAGCGIAELAVAV